VANMSHELRTPLNAIMGFSEMLKDGLLGELTERQKNSAGAIFDSGMHLLALINDILDLSRIEAGKMELELAKTDVGELLHNSVTMLQTRASAHHIELKLEAQATEPVWVDQRKSRQIVYNLLSNAVKFTPDGGRIGLAAHLDPDDAGAVRLVVSDSGIGIPQADLDRVFARFYRTSTANERAIQGSGLGLSIVRAIVEGHGGSVEVESVPEHGASFTVRLPVPSSDVLPPEGSPRTYRDQRHESRVPTGLEHRG